MDVKFEVAGRINKPVEEVFEAVVNPGILSKYFATGGASGRLEQGKTVMWAFGEFSEQYPVQVAEIERNRRIILRWECDEAEQGGDRFEDLAKYLTTVTMSFEPLEDGRTLLSIKEEGWRDTPAGRHSSYGNCMGWSHMQCALKAWLEHGINLREGMYR